MVLAILRADVMWHDRGGIHKNNNKNKKMRKKKLYMYVCSHSASGTGLWQLVCRLQLYLCLLLCSLIFGRAGPRRVVAGFCSLIFGRSGPRRVVADFCSVFLVVLDRGGW